MNERHARLLEWLVERGRIEVPELAGLLGVSQVTVRKDLDTLSAQGLVRRGHGVAALSSQDDLANRLAYHYAAKKRIAILAAECVADGETVMIESGSCCALLAETLVQAHANVTIVTNSAFIADHLRGRGTATVVLLGGMYQPESQVLVGPLTRLGAEAFRVDKLFIGMDGFSASQGFMGADLMRAEAVRVLAARAAQVMILSESEKFLRQGTVVDLLPMKAVRRVYTDAALLPEIEKNLSESGISVWKTKGD